jgi:hypothetical protein
VGPPVSSTNKTDHHDIAEILLKVASNTIKPTNQLKIFLQNFSLMDEQNLLFWCGSNVTLSPGTIVQFDWPSLEALYCSKTVYL